MERGGGLGSTGQDESREGLQLLFEPIDLVLERLDILLVRLGNAGLLPVCGVRRREEGANVE